VCLPLDTGYTQLGWNISIRSNDNQFPYQLGGCGCSSALTWAFSPCLLVCWQISGTYSPSVKLRNTAGKFWASASLSLYRRHQMFYDVSRKTYRRPPCLKRPSQFSIHLRQYVQVNTPNSVPIFSRYLLVWPHLAIYSVVWMMATTNGLDLDSYRR
jgi:hypothetical protein